MSGKMIRLSVGGAEYEMPEQDALAAMQHLDSKGVKFTGDEVPQGGAAVFSEPDPTQPPSQHGATDSWDSPAPAAPEPKPWYQALADGMGIHQLKDGETPPLDPEAIKAFEDKATVGGWGRQFGATLGAMASGAPIAKGAGFLANVGGQAARGAIGGGTAAYADNPEHDAVKALEAAGVSGAVSGTLGAVGSGLTATGNALGNAGDSARLKSWGVPADEITALAERYGLPEQQAGRDLVQRGEALVPPNTFFPKSVGSWNQGFRDAKGAAGAQVGQNIDAAMAQGVPMPADPRGTIAGNLYQQADQSMANGMHAGTLEGSALSNEARAVELGPQFNTPHDLRAQKTAFDRTAFKGQPGTPEAYAGQAALASGNQFRGMLGDYMGQASPEVNQGFQRASQNYGDAALLQDATGNASAKQISGGGMLGNMGIGMLGAAAGAPFGMAPLGAAAGLARPAYAAARNLGSDFGANIGGMGEAVAGTMGDATNWIAAQAPTATMTMMRASQPQSMQQQPQASDAGNSSDNARGYLAPQVIGQMLQQGQMPPQYAQQFSQAKDEHEIAAIYERLVRTDPQFARNVAPQIQMQTTGGQ
jgi:hypothetical protein